MPHTYIKKILDARVYDIARETPIDHARLLSARLGNRVLNLGQVPFSFYYMEGGARKWAVLSKASLNALQNDRPD